MDALTPATAATATSTTPMGQGSVDPDAQPVISSDFETFLEMLSTQLQNQDPMNPVKSEDFAVQLATFSSVEQQVLTNNLLQNLTGQMVASSMSDLAGWVGMEARSAAAASWQGDPIRISSNPLAAADTTVLVVRNAAGNVVHQARVPVTADTLEWDGTDATGAVLPHGTYSFELENYAQGELLAVDRLESYAPITEARIIDGETVLVTDAGTLLPTDMVTGLRKPD